MFRVWLVCSVLCFVAMGVIWFVESKNPVYGVEYYSKKHIVMELSSIFYILFYLIFSFVLRAFIVSDLASILG